MIHHFPGYQQNSREKKQLAVNHTVPPVCYVYAVWAVSPEIFSQDSSFSSFVIIEILDLTTYIQITETQGQDVASPQGASRLKERSWDLPGRRLAEDGDRHGKAPDVQRHKGKDLSHQPVGTIDPVQVVTSVERRDAHQHQGPGDPAQPHHPA